MITNEWLLETAARAAGVLALTAVLVRTVSRSSASLRHLAWAIALGGVIMVPLLSRLLPFRLAVLPAAPIMAVREDAPPALVALPKQELKQEELKDREPSPAAIEPALTPTPKRISWASLLPVIWLVGAGALLLRLSAGFWALSTITRRGRSLENTDWTDVLDRTRAWMDVRERPLLLVSERVAMPCTSGWRRPVIILPEGALEWDDQRREMVLLHELAHIRRGDILWHLIAQVAVAIHWFNPFVWAAARAMRADAERAADDLVVGAGATPADYAAHLLDIVRGSPARREPASVVPFAQRSEFEGRLLAILESKGVTMPTPRASLLTAALAIAAVLPVAALSAARPAPVLASVNETEATEVHQQATTTTRSTRESTTLLMNTLSDSVVSVRTAAAEALGGLKDTMAVRALIDVLKRDTDAGVRRAAAWALGELEDARAIPALSEALRTDTDVEVRRNAAHALGEIEDARAVPALTEAIRRDKDPSVRRAIVEALSSIEDPSSATVLFPILKDSDPEMRRAAADALGSIENVNSVDELIPLVRDESKEVRRAAVDALGSIEDKRALPALARALGDSDVEVRRAAANAIGSLDEVHSAPPELIRALRDEDPEVRRNAVNALSSIDDPAGVAPLAALLKDQDVEIRRAAAEALEDIEDANATRALREALRDEDPEVRRIAAKALGNRSR
jgi:HEAT repeat protein/beta-lactamase regulating signal transducer with metallopeptidase domain